MSENSNGGGIRIGLGSLLTVLFIILKLTDRIDWSWWWVLCPIWIPLVFVGIMVYIVARFFK